MPEVTRNAFISETRLEKVGEINKLRNILIFTVRDILAFMRFVVRIIIGEFMIDTILLRSYLERCDGAVKVNQMVWKVV